jgi:hypothetical protein
LVIDEILAILLKQLVTNEIAIAPTAPIATPTPLLGPAHFPCIPALSPAHFLCIPALGKAVTAGGTTLAASVPRRSN